MFDFSRSMTKRRLSEFADYLLALHERIGFKISTRGWCYQLESERIINKDQFDKVERGISQCQKTGLLPVDFIAEEESRQFSGVEKPEDCSPREFLAAELQKLMKNAYWWYTPDWWAGETCYIQMEVEKIDLKTLFEPTCEKYHIPIATTKGWASVRQRAELARRFQQAEEDGLKCVLLYCGDHDPDGLRISKFIRKNLTDVQEITWEDGTPGYNPKNLIIERFGLNAEFIEQHRLTWIDNLKTGSGKDLASPSHKNHAMPYVQTYIDTYGIRKCEANAIVPMPQVAEELVEETILSYLGHGAVERFSRKRQAVSQDLQEFQQQPELQNMLAYCRGFIESEN